LNTEEALKVTLDMLLGAKSIPVKARMKDPISDEELGKLYDAIEILTKKYSNEHCIPKKLAACFVDNCITRKSLSAFF
jgi:hypothetical protein